ncbi:hypothetical protein LTR78_005374 [Recurvomyces mirabilis]|uniref:Zn(2)-C6 fungal-type domain-containing protein n=1 Tax=Recurvomyces mirabilis TaxID=574656 RepID=A0AAE1C1P8_9PEZI|nr:hypothetical protein LTR78_005374 [Recurvomyces mirabilis]KAK5152719.1 hypothetical protein LTS14_008253 [Recurvomyces mirabilis]
MASEYQGVSPSSDMLNLAGSGGGGGGGGGGMAPPSLFGGSQSGSEYGFGTPQSLHLDTVMQVNGPPGGSMNSYRSAPAGGMQSYGNAFDGSAVLPPLSANGHMGGRGGGGGGYGETALPAHHRHRLSMSDGGHYGELAAHNSELGSDTTSPGAHGRPSVGDNVYGNLSNDTLSTQAPLGDNTSSNKPTDPALQPSWSELKTKAGKERKRLPLACIACRRKKIRCSGEKPACKHCLRSRIPCVYKVTTRKAAPRTDYMAMLDKRLKRMEDRVIKFIPKDEQMGTLAATGRANVKPPLPAAPGGLGVGGGRAGGKKRGAEVAFGGEELDEWAAAGGPKPGSAVEGEGGATRRGGQGDGGEEQAPHDAEERNLLLEGADKLPSKEIQEHLTEVYFDYVYGQSYHLLHKPSFLRKLAHGKIPPVLILAVCAISARFSNHPDLRGTEPAFLRGEQWAGPARDIALSRYDTPNITILISYLILGLHEFGTCQGGRSWMLCGMAQRMAYALQLHNDLDHDPKIRRGSSEAAGKGAGGGGGDGELTFTDREIRRRTVWSCFLMDRFTSSGSDRPIFVAEQYIKAQLPIREDYYLMEITGPTEDLAGAVPNPVEVDTGQLQDPKDNMGIAAYLVRLVSIWGRVIQYLNLGGKDRDEMPMWAEDSVFQGMVRSLDAWEESLPDWMQYSAENLQNFASLKLANQFLFLHILHRQVVLFMNRFALPTPGRRSDFPPDMPGEFVQASSRKALEAANMISALIHEAMDHLVVAPFAGYCAFFASTVHIHGAFSRDKVLEAESKRNLAWNVKFLTKMKKFWGMFHFVTENLRELYRRHADAARSGGGGSASAVQVGGGGGAAAGAAVAGGKDGGGEEDKGEIFQYGDWFDRYPHGVSGTDYEEPSAEVKREPGADGVLGQKSDLQTVEDFFAKLSPPSRAAAVQSQQGGSGRRGGGAAGAAAKKRRASKSEKRAAAEAAAAAVVAGDVNVGAASVAAGGQLGVAPSTGDLQALQAMQAQQNLLAAQQGFASDGGTLEALQRQQHSIAFPPGYQQPPNPLLGSPPQHLLSQLDRQMVLNSYAGIDQSAGNVYHMNGTNLLGSAQHAPLDPFNLDAFSGLPSHTTHPVATASNHGNGNGNVPSAGSWGDPSTAWFMPFNMEPPTIGDDNNLFGGGGAGNFDWGMLNGFGEMGGLAPTGLTPQGGGIVGEVDGGVDVDGRGGEGGFEGL